MASLESRIMAKEMPVETQRVLTGFQIPTSGADGLDVAFSLIEEWQSFEEVSTFETNQHLLATEPTIVSDEAEEREKARAMVNLLNELSPTERRVLYEKYYEGKSNTEIGVEFGKSRDFASKIHAAALAKIRNNPNNQHLKEFIR